MSALSLFLESISKQCSSLDLSGELLNKIEYYVLFSSKSDLQPQIGYLISTLLSYFHKKTEEISFDTKDVIGVFRIFRFFRSQCLDADQIKQLEDFAIKILHGDNNDLKIQAFLLMIENIAQLKRTDFSTYLKFVDWVLDYIKKYNPEDSPLMIPILTNIVFVISYFNEIKIPINEIIFELIQKAKFILAQNDDSDNFKTNEHIIRKIFGSLSRIFHNTHSIPEKAIEEILNLKEMIPDSIQFSLVFQSYIPLFSLVLEQCAKKNYPLPNTITSFLQSEYVMNLPFFTFLPHAKNKRIQQATNRITEYTMRLSNNYSEFLPLIWPLLYSVSNHSNTSQYLFADIQKIIKENIDKQVPNFIPNILRQIIGCLSILKQDILLVDRESKSKSFEYDSWMITTHFCIKLFPYIIASGDISKYEIEFLEAYNELTRFAAFILDLYTAQSSQNAPDIEYSPEFLHQLNRSDFAKRMVHIIQEYIKIIAPLPSNFKVSILNQNLILLLPTKSYHSFHKIVHQHIIKIINDPTMYHVSFFRLVSHNFEKLFLPTPLPHLLDLTRSIFQDAFGSDAKASIFANAPPSMVEDIASFIWKILASKHAVLIELLLTVFVLFFPIGKAARVPVFLNQLKESPNLMILLLNNLSEDTDLKVFTGLLALFFYPSCYPNYEQADQWTNLFLPALESDIHLYGAVHVLYSDTSKIFPMWVKKLNKPTQLRLVTALTASLAKLKQNERCYPLALLSRIPELTTELSMTLHDTKKRKIKIELDGFTFYAENILDIVKKIDTDNINLSQRIFKEILKKVEFVELMTNQTFSNFCQILVKNKSLVLDDYSDNNLVYKTVFLRGYYLQDFEIEKIPNLEEFLGIILMLCINRNYSDTIIKFIEICLPRIPVSELYVTIATALLHMSNFSYKKVLTIFRQIYFNLPYDKNEEISIGKKICNKFQSSLTSPNKYYRRLVIKVLSFYDEKKIHNFPCPSNYGDVFKTISSGINNHPYRFQFIVKNIQNLQNPSLAIDFMLQSFERLNLHTIPEEVFPVLESNYFFGIESGKFNISVLSRLLSIVPKDNKMVTQLLSFLNTLKQQKFVKFIPYFLKKCEKRDLLQMFPRNLESYVKVTNGLPEIPAHYSDALLIEFASRLEGFSNTNEVYNWCNLCLKSMMSENRFISQNVLLTFEKVTNIVYNVKKSINIDQFVITLLDVLSMIKFNHMENDCDFSKICSQFQEEIPRISLNNFIYQDFNAKSFVTFVDILTLEDLDDLRNNFIKLIHENSSKIIEFFTSKSDSQFTSFIFSYLLTKFTEKSKILQNIDIILLIDVITFLFRPLIFNFEPSLFISISKILFPAELASNYNKSSQILAVFVNQVIPFIKSYPMFFFQPLVIRLLTVFCKKLPEDSHQIVQSCLTKNEEFKSEIDRCFSLALTDVSVAVFGISDIKLDLSNAGRGLLSLISLNFAYSIGKQGIQFEDPIYLQNTASLHFNILKGKASFNDSPTLNRLMNCLLSLNTENFNLDKKETSEIVSNYLDVTPLVSNASHSCYKNCGQHSELFDTDNERIIRFLVALPVSNLSNMKYGLDINELYYIPIILAKVDHSKSKIWNEQILEIYNEIIEFFSSSNLKIYYYRFYPRAIREAINNLEDKKPKKYKMFDIFKQKLKDEINEEMALHDIRSLMSIMIDLAPFVMTHDMDIPPALLPNNLLSPQRMQTKDFYSLFQKAVESCEETLGVTFSQKLIEKFCENLSSNSEIDPIKLGTPFATAAAWKDQFDKMNKLHKPLSVLFESLCPHKMSDFADAVNSLKHPISADTYSFVRKMLNERFKEKFSDWLQKTPFLSFFFTKPSENLIPDLWDIKWFDVKHNFHLRIFANMIMPQWYSCLLDQISEKDLKMTIAPVISDIEEKYPEFRKFSAYYVSLCPNSSLAESLWTSKAFKKSMPLPTMSLFENRNFLYQKNLCEDALGLLKSEYKELNKAATYHQLANYKAAFSEYLEAMTKSNRIYSLSLVELRSVSCNLSLVRQMPFNDIFKVSNASPQVTLPFLMNFNPQNEIKTMVSYQTYNPENFTSYFSQIYLPFLTRSAMIEEIYKSLQILRQRTAQSQNIPDLIKPWMVTWMNTLDKLTATCSGIAWRMTIIAKMKETTEMQPNTPIFNSLSQCLQKNYSKLSSLLQHSGAVKSALKLLNFGGEIEKFHVTKSSLGRIYNFLTRNNSEKLTAISEQLFIMLHDFRGIKSNKHWLKLMFEVSKCFPVLIEPNSFFSRIAMEMKESKNESRDFIIALALNFVRIKPESIPIFHQLLLQVVPPKQMQTQGSQSQQIDLKNIWLRWLPMIIKHAKSPPDGFLLALLERHPMHFLMSIKSLMNSDSCSEIAKEIYIKVMQKKSLSVFEFEESFTWIEKLKKEIDDFDFNVNLFQKLIKMIDDENVEISDEEKEKIGGENFDDFVNYCKENPPYFFVDDKSCQSISATGTRFTSIQLNVNSLSLITTKSDEASLRLSTTIGEIRYFSLVSPRIYGFTFQEHMFSALIKRMIDNHPSNVSRSKFNNFVPYTFLLSPKLMIVHHGPINSLYSAIGLDDICERLKEIKKIDSDQSPFAKKVRKNCHKMNDLHKWFIGGTEGIYVDFLMMRQAFASSLAFTMALRVCFSASLPSIPNVCFSLDRQKVVLPGYFLKRENTVTLAPLTNAFRSFLPNFLLKGSFESSWLSTIDSLAKHITKIRIILDVLRSSGENEVSNSQICNRIEMLAPCVGEDTENVESEFAFDIINHLIENSQNITDLHASYAWI
ncbi:hypothetical protein TVAG_456980 [Trichomonas vaginalis G3]|uniref:Uncharacterized protein n=1 Tax=Trichomonas vaginalis (strain ATCC PRA-98 / G3) TaxID=412133 RepID=A2DC22_TRIV3|nr:hypothetical protein TVAGG3_0263660 [Trichomonas vaginalis G3]EAY22063.1 hypothetical protein TVAG_456980 [Trichomonas vaginalis G3]KAI5525308.1 hypothetical protein TVAGG3_0263660 [Trichomonas vaginalis G3]|eukprot:XP_001583049.1 hypothetical protein [Trichomonas vaginalis G3]